MLIVGQRRETVLEHLRVHLHLWAFAWDRGG